MAVKLQLSQFADDDNAHPDELIVKLQGADKVWALKNKIIVPISHIESIKVADPANIQDRRLVKVVGAGIASFKVGDFLECNHDKEENRLLFLDIHHKQAAVDGKVIIMTLRYEKYNELVLEVDDDESEKVMKEFQAMRDEASS
jgi:hypothetical protein